MLRAIVVFLLLASPIRAWAAPQDSIAAARDLYTTAGYDEALAMLTRLRNATTVPADVRAIDQYRAFALFAIGRAGEAERVVEGITLLDPMWTLSDGEAPPRIAALFAQARERAMPGVLRQRLNAARALYSEKHYAAAAEAFTSVLTLLDDPTVARTAGADALSIGSLATGFRDLALAADEQAARAAAAAKPADPGPASVEPAALAQADPAPAEPLPADPKPATAPPTAPPTESSQVPTTANEGAPIPPALVIVPPVAIAQAIPRLTDVSIPMGGPQTILLDIVIDETGRVERADVRKSVDRLYETQLVAATRGWRYSPATQGGRPVKYLRTLEVTLNPR